MKKLLIFLVTLVSPFLTWAQIPVANFSFAVPVCATQSIVVSDLSTNTPTAWSYTLVGGTPASSSVQNPTVTFASAGVHTITLVSSNISGSSTSVTQTFVVNNTPTVSVNSGAICSGSSFTILPSGASSYTYFPGGMTGFSTVVTPIATTAYSVIGTVAGCVSGQVLSTVVVNPLPTVNATSSPSLVCVGQTATLTAASLFTYTWSTGATGASIVVSPTISTSYSVTGTNTNGCIPAVSGIVNLNVNALPNVSAIGSPGSICPGQTTTLTAGGATSYLWSNGATSASTTASPINTTTYSVIGTNVNGCQATATTVINTSSSKNISGQITTNTVTPVPVSGKVILYKYEGGYSKYDSLDYQTIDALGNYTFAAQQAGNYILLAQPTATNLQETYANGYVGWKSATVLNHGCMTNTVQNINVIALTNIGTGPGLLTGKILQGLNYGQKGTAVVPGGPIKGAQVKCGRNPGGDAVGQSVTDPAGGYTISALPYNGPGESYFILIDIPGLDTNGTYHRVITAGTPTFVNLDFVADSAKINPGAYVGIKKITANKAELKVYPNPTHGIINVEVGLLSETEIDIKVFTLLGKEMFSCSPKIMNKKIQLDLTDLPDGFYFMKFEIGDQERTTKIILTR